jgi:hypothetical protein
VETPLGVRVATSLEVGLPVAEGDSDRSGELEAGCVILFGWTRRN